MSSSLAVVRIEWESATTPVVISLSWFSSYRWWRLKAGSMRELLFKRAIVAVVGSVLCSSVAAAQSMDSPYQPSTKIPPPAEKAARVEILQGPVLEFARDDFAI